MQQVYVPKIVFPLVVILTDLVKFGVVLGLLLIYLWLAGFNIGWAYLALLVCYRLNSVDCRINSFSWRRSFHFAPDDLKCWSSILLCKIFLFISFSSSTISENYKTYFYLNPMASIIGKLIAIF